MDYPNLVVFSRVIVTQICSYSAKSALYKIWPY